MNPCNINEQKCRLCGDSMKCDKPCGADNLANKDLHICGRCVAKVIAGTGIKAKTCMFCNDADHYDDYMTCKRCNALCCGMCASLCETEGGYICPVCEPTSDGYKERGIDFCPACYTKDCLRNKKDECACCEKEFRVSKKTPKCVDCLMFIHIKCSKSKCSKCGICPACYYDSCECDEQTCESCEKTTNKE